MSAQPIIRHSEHFDRGIFSKGTTVNRPDFTDQRVFLVAPNDARVARYYIKPETVACDVEQSCSGPIYLVIGAAADNELLSRAANRFGMPISGLLKHRDGQISLTRIRAMKRVAKEKLSHIGIQRFCVIYRD